MVVLKSDYGYSVYECSAKVVGASFKLSTQLKQSQIQTLNMVQTHPQTETESLSVAACYRHISCQN